MSNKYYIRYTIFTRLYFFYYVYIDIPQHACRLLFCPLFMKNRQILMFSGYITLLLKENGGIFSIIIMEALFTDYKMGWASVNALIWLCFACTSITTAGATRGLNQIKHVNLTHIEIFWKRKSFSTFEKCKWRKTKQAWDTLVSPIPFYKGKTSPTTVILINDCTAAANLFLLFIQDRWAHHYFHCLAVQRWHLWIWFYGT